MNFAVFYYTVAAIAYLLSQKTNKTESKGLEHLIYKRCSRLRGIDDDCDNTFTTLSFLTRFDPPPDLEWLKKDKCFTSLRGSLATSEECKGEMNKLEKILEIGRKGNFNNQPCLYYDDLDNCVIIE